MHQLIRRCKGLMEKLHHTKKDYVNDILEHSIVNE